MKADGGRKSTPGAKEYSSNSLICRLKRSSMLYWRPRSRILRRSFRSIATIGKLRLFASEQTVEAADKVMSRIIETYYGPRIDLQTRPTPSHTPDILREFSERCRAELRAYDH